MNHGKGAKVFFYNVAAVLCDYSTWSFRSASNSGCEHNAHVSWCRWFSWGRDGLSSESLGVRRGTLASLLHAAPLAPRCLSWAPTFHSGAKQVQSNLHRARHFRYSEDFFVSLCGAKYPTS